MWIAFNIQFMAYWESIIEFSSLFRCQVCSAGRKNSKKLERRPYYFLKRQKVLNHRIQLENKKVIQYSGGTNTISFLVFKRKRDGLIWRRDKRYKDRP